MGRQFLHLLALIVVVLLGVPAMGFASIRGIESSSNPPAGHAVVITIHGHIDDSTSRLVTRGLQDAQRLGASTVILDLDTPGGLVTSALEISAALKQQTSLHTIAYVQHMALSAGTMIAVACDEIVMQPGSMIGDSAPINFSPGGELRTLGETERAKAESPILADFRDSARRNGYDPLLLESMVAVGRVVHWVHKDGQPRRFVNEQDFKQLQSEGWTEVNEPGVPRPIDAADTLLTVHSDVAMKLGLAKQTAPDINALLTAGGLQLARTYAPSGADEVLEMLASPLARFLVLTLFLLALYAAAHAPGHGFAEVVAIVSLGTLITIPLLTGYAQWWEALMIVLGLGLLAAELFVVPGTAITGLSGIVLVVVGMVMTFVGNTDVPGAWKSGALWSGVQTGLLVVVGALVCSIVLFLWMRQFLPKLPYMNRLILGGAEHGAGTSIADALIAAGGADVWPFRGTVGRAVTDLKPGGTAQFPYGDDERASSVVAAEGAYVHAGAKIIVQDVRGNRVVVRAV